MKKTYLIGSEEWIWDTDTLKWCVMRKANAIEAIKKVIVEESHEEEWPSWKEFLYLTFRGCRAKSTWNLLRSLHDEEDNEYFNFLEGYFKRGKLKIL